MWNEFFNADYSDSSAEMLRHGVLLVVGAPSASIAGRAGARPDHSIIRRRSSSGIRRHRSVPLLRIFHLPGGWS